MKTIGIVDFNPDQKPDEIGYIRRISALIPTDYNWEGFVFRDARDIGYYDALILSGSKLSATYYQRMKKQGKIEGDDYIYVDKFAEQLSDYDGPVLGICFGNQLLAHSMGSELDRLEQTEVGYLPHELTSYGKRDRVFGHLNDTFYGAHMHRDFVKTLPIGENVSLSHCLAKRNGMIHAFGVLYYGGNDRGRVMRYGVQPHPEMSTPDSASFFPTIRKGLLTIELGPEEVEKALVIPSGADFEFSKIITNFVSECV
jgi:GMP synthase-like glutamine amidotransferase